MLNIVVLVSGGGTNLQALIEAEKSGKISNGSINYVISSNQNAYALNRAHQNNISTKIVNRKSFSNSKDFDNALIDCLNECNPDLIVLAGFMCILGKKVIKRYENKIINVHPSLIPSFSGKGYYGLKVHEAALSCGVKITGATVHFVNEIPDGGAIILQKSVDVLPDDTAETLQSRVMKEAEWDILPKAVDLFCTNKIEINNNLAYINDRGE